MADHPPNSIDIDSIRQDYDSTPASTTESLKSTVVTQKKVRLFYHQLTQLIYRRVQKHHPIKKIGFFRHKVTHLFNRRTRKHHPINMIIPKLIKLLKITHIIMIIFLPDHQIILLPKRMSPVQVTNKMILMRNQDINKEIQ